MTDQPTSCPDILALTVYAAEAGDDFTRAQIARHLSSCEVCRRRAESLASERTAFLAAQPIERTVTLPRRKVIPFPVYRTVYALAAALLIAAGISIYYAANSKPGIDTRIKGGPRISLYVQESDGSAVVRPGNIFHPGERMQFVCASGGYSRLALLSIDDNGRVSTYYPQSGDSAMAIEPGIEAPLPNSIVLDDYIGRELYVVALSPKPFLLSKLKRRLQSAFQRTPDIERMAIDPGAGIALLCVLIRKTAVQP